MESSTEADPLKTALLSHYGTLPGYLLDLIHSPLHVLLNGLTPPPARICFKGLVSKLVVLVLNDLLDLVRTCHICFLSAFGLVL